MPRAESSCTPRRGHDHQSTATPVISKVRCAKLESRKYCFQPVVSLPALVASASTALWAQALVRNRSRRILSSRTTPWEPTFHAGRRRELTTIRSEPRDDLRATAQPGTSTRCGGTGAETHRNRRGTSRVPVWSSRQILCYVAAYDAWSVAQNLERMSSQNRPDWTIEDGEMLASADQKRGSRLA